MLLGVGAHHLEDAHFIASLAGAVCKLGALPGRHPPVDGSETRWIDHVHVDDLRAAQVGAAVTDIDRRLVHSAIALRIEVAGPANDRNAPRGDLHQWREFRGQHIAAAQRIKCGAQILQLRIRPSLDFGRVLLQCLKPAVVISDLGTAVIIGGW